MIGTPIALTQGEQRIAKFIGKCRNQHKIFLGLKNTKIDTAKTNETIDVNGFAAEMAFCKLHNLYPDYWIGLNSAKQGIDKGDCKLGRYWVDVKAPALHRYVPATEEMQTWAMPQEIGCIAPRAQGGFIAALRRGFYRLAAESRKLNRRGAAIQPA